MTVMKDRHKGADICALSVMTLVLSLLASHAQAATSVYLDNNGTTAGSGIANGGSYSWESAIWNTNSAGTTTTPAVWVDGEFPRFVAGSDAAANNYSVTASSNHTIAGMFLNTNGGGTVSINGPGVLSITSGQQGFFIQGSGQTLAINAKLSGVGGVQTDTTGSIDLFGNNDYAGGTLLNGVGGVNINNNNSFGTAGITWGVAQQVLADDTASSPITLPNAMTTRAASTLIYVGPAAAPLTLNNTVTLVAGTSTFTIGNAAHLSTQITIAGAIGGAGGNLVVNGTSGKLTITSASNSYTGSTTVGGTTRLVLGAPNSIATSTGVTLSGGTLDPDGMNQNMATNSTLAMTASSTIDYGVGASEVDFKNSAAATWTGTLNLANWDYANSTTLLRFGTDATGLTPAQLAKITFNGGGAGTAQLDINGYVVPEPATAALLFLGAPLLLARRRRAC